MFGASGKLSLRLSENGFDFHTNTLGIAHHFLGSCVGSFQRVNEVGGVAEIEFPLRSSLRRRESVIEYTENVLALTTVCNEGWLNYQKEEVPVENKNKTRSYQSEGLQSLA